MRKIGLIVILLLTVIGVEVMAASYYQTYLPIVYKQPTPSPTPEPTATSIPPNGVQILPNSYDYWSGDMMHVVGEVVNNTSESLYYVEVVVNFFDAYGHLVATDSTVLTPLNLPAREKGCFSIILDVPPDWYDYEFEAPTYDIGSSSADLIIFGEAGSYNPSNGDYDITGEVRNDGGQPSNSVSVGGTLYDKYDMPVGCNYIYVDPTDIDPHQISSFALNYWGVNRDYNDVTHYSLRVAGDLP